jgi:Glycosyl hydrolase family 26
MKIKGSTAIIASVALLATSVVGYAIGKANSESATTSNFHNESSVGKAPTSDLGFYPGFGSVSLLQSLEMWLGKSAGHVVQFADADPANFTASVWGEVVRAGALQTVANRVTLVESVPLAFGPFVDASTATGQATARASLTATVSGKYDDKFTRAANYLRGGGYGDAVIRLGWEFDGGWYPWSSNGNEALWISAYRHVVDVFRAVSPDFRFDWNGTRAHIAGATAAYPGDDYVDIIGLDVYDKGAPVTWSNTTKSWTDPAAAWKWQATSLEIVRTMAIAHGKQVSVPEWGLTGVTSTVTSKVGGDDPTFVQGMSDWIKSLPSSGAGSLAYQSYFNADVKDGNHKINANHFPKAEARYRALFGGTDVPSTLPGTNPPTTVPPTTTTEPATTTTTTVEATFSYTVTCGVVSHACTLSPAR